MDDAPKGHLGADLARGAARAVLTAGGFAALTWVGPWYELPTTSAAYFGALAIPCAVLESWLVRSRVRVSLVWIAATWLALAVALCVLHAQAVYASGVVSTGSLTGGTGAVWDEAGRLPGLLPGEAGTLAGLRFIHFFSVTVASVVMALTPTALARARVVGVGWWASARAWLETATLCYLLGIAAIALIYTPAALLEPAVLMIAACLLAVSGLPACGVVLVSTALADGPAMSAVAPRGAREGSPAGAGPPAPGRIQPPP